MIQMKWPLIDHNTTILLKSTEIYRYQYGNHVLYITLPVCVHVVQGNINVKSHNMVEDKPSFRAIHGAINARMIPGCVTLLVVCDIRYHFILLYDRRSISLYIPISHNDNDCLFMDCVNSHPLDYVLHIIIHHSELYHTLQSAFS